MTPQKASTLDMTGEWTGQKTRKFVEAFSFPIKGSPRIPWADVEKAQLRVGVGPEKRLHWALQFADTNLDEATAADFVNLRVEHAAFRLCLIWWNRLRISNQSRIVLMRKFGHHQLTGSTPLERSPIFPTLDELHRTQERFKQLLGEITAVGIASYRITVDLEIQGPLRVGRDVQDFDNEPLYGGGPGIRPLVRVPDKVGGAVMRLAQLLVAFGEKVHRCPKARGGCGRLFVGPVNKEFCGGKCVSRSTSRTYLEKHGKKPKAKPKKGAKR